MGYYTIHELEAKQPDGSDLINHEDGICAITDYESLFDGESVKWYAHENDMRKYSKKHPDTLFTLKGEGEESCDLWVEYYKNGLMQRCKAKITFEEFNAESLE